MRMLKFNQKAVTAKPTGVNESDILIIIEGMQIFIKECRVIIFVSKSQRKQTCPC